MASNALTKWKNATAYDETYRIKRNQVLMFFQRGYKLHDFEIRILANKEACDKYFYALYEYEKNKTPQDKILFDEALEDFYDEIDNQSYDDLVLSRNYFIQVVEDIAQKDNISFRDALTAHYQMTPTSLDVARVVFMNYYPKRKITATDINLIISDAVLMSNVTRLIIFLPQDHASDALAHLKGIRSRLSIEIFPEEQMRFAPTQHKLQPYFKVMDNADAKQFLQLGVDQRNLPKILSKDPVVKFLGIESKKIFEYHRENNLNQVSKTSFYARTL